MPRKPTEKQKLIAKIISLQKKFIVQQRKTGISAKEYYSPDEDDALSGYLEEHEKLATEVIDLAHREQGTSR